jgi:FkbM family methyltransferase
MIDGSVAMPLVTDLAKSPLRSLRETIGRTLRRALPAGDYPVAGLTEKIAILESQLLAVQDELKYLRTFHEPIHFREGTLDRFIYHDVAIENEYRLPAQFDSRDVILDIGGHIGSFAHSCLVRGAGRVVVYEAEADNHRWATRNLWRHGPRVEVRYGAVWRSDQPVQVLHFNKSSDPRNTGGGHVLGTGTVAVPAVAFDAVVAELTASGQRIRLLKLDCEGSEYPILFTARLLDRVDEILGEYHEDRSDPRHTGAALKQHLEHNGFRVELQPNPKNPAVGEFFASRNG